MANPLRIESNNRAADIDQSLSVSLNSQPNSTNSTPSPSPRQLQNEPCSRWGVREVDVQTFRSRHETRVTVMFADETHQKIPLGQFIYLVNKGVDKIEFALLERKIEFIFKDDAKAQKFAEVLRKVISSNANPTDDFHSPSAQPIFKNWQIDEMVPGDSKGIPHVKATFILNDMDKRRVIFKQLTQLREKGVVEMSFDLEQPVVYFNFLEEANRDAFFAQMDKQVQKPPMVRSGSQTDPKPDSKESQTPAANAANV